VVKKLSKFACATLLLLLLFLVLGLLIDSTDTEFTSSPIAMQCYSTQVVCMLHLVQVVQLVIH